jgi:butyrate kinase
MILSLDYDGTYTLNPAAWDKAISALRASGATVYLVTMRYDVPHEADEVRQALTGKVDDMFFTGRLAKRNFMYGQGIHIQVWIDDQPDFILNSAI